MAEENKQEDDEFDAEDAFREEPELDSDVEVIVDESDEGVEVAAEAEDSDPVEVEDEPVEQEAAEADEPEEDDSDAELRAMPDKIKKRFMREKRLRDEIIQEREQVKAVAIRAAQIAQEKESVLAQRDAEVAEIRKAHFQLQKQYADTLEFSFEQAIQIQASNLKKAREDGDYDAELKTQAELDKLRFQQNQVRDSKRSIPDPASVQVPVRPMFQAPPQQSAPQQQAEPPEPRAVKWIERNAKWFNSPKFAGQRAFALAEDNNLVREGYDKKTVEYYQELDRRIDKAFPALRKRVPGKGSPVAGVSSGSSKTSSRTIRLNRSDLSNMRAFGLDPSNKEHLSAYAKSKRAAA